MDVTNVLQILSTNAKAATIAGIAVFLLLFGLWYGLPLARLRKVR